MNRNRCRLPLAIGYSLACLLAACRDGAEADPQQLLDKAAIVGRYGQNENIDVLIVSADGSFTCEVSNGVTDEGCGNIIGMGVSWGDWSLDSNGLRFTPTHETEDLAISLQGARALVYEHGMLLRMGAGEHYLAKQLPTLLSTRKATLTSVYFRVDLDPQAAAPEELSKHMRELVFRVGQEAREAGRGRLVEYSLYPKLLTISLKSSEAERIIDLTRGLLAATHQVQGGMIYTQVGYEEDAINTKQAL